MYKYPTIYYLYTYNRANTPLFHRYLNIYARIEYILMMMKMLMMMIMIMGELEGYISITGSDVGSINCGYSRNKGVNLMNLNNIKLI